MIKLLISIASPFVAFAGIIHGAWTHTWTGPALAIGIVIGFISRMDAD